MDDQDNVGVPQIPLPPQEVVGLSTPSTPASPKAKPPRSNMYLGSVQVGQRWVPKDKRRQGQIITIREVGYPFHFAVSDNVRGKRSTAILDTRLRTKYRLL